MPTVSIVVPCYNYGHFVTECVTSLLANTTADLDILVVDDASPDDSWAVVERLPRLDRRIRVHRNEHNRGLISTANDAIVAATGDYIVLLSADDALAPGWLDRGVSFLEFNRDSVLAYGPTRRFRKTLPTLHVKRRVRPFVYAGHDWIEQSCGRGVTPILSPEVIVRRSAQHEVGGYRRELPFSSDMEMWLRLASIGDVVRVAGPVAAFYRVSEQSMSRDIYLDLLRELEVRRDAFDAWYRFADGYVPDRDGLMTAARRSLARRAVRRACAAYLQDPIGAQFDSVCKFAVDNDPAWAVQPVSRLRAVASHDSARRVRDRLLPVTKLGTTARRAASDVRARLHVI